MFCINCKKEIPNGSRVCPECGAQQGGKSAVHISGVQNQQTGQKGAYNKMAIIGLVISVISLFLNFWGIVGIAGIIVSVIGFINCSQTNENGKTLSIVGIAIGAFSVLYALSVLS